MLGKGSNVKIISGSLKGETGVIICEDRLQWKKSFWVNVCRKGKVSLWASRLIKMDKFNGNIHSQQVR